MRTNSSHPSSNSWLPTALKSRPIWLKASIVGSSWNKAESKGLAPIRSPAETTTVLGLSARKFAIWVARYSAPPATTFGAGQPDTAGTHPELLVGGSRFPWKSFSARSWTLTVPEGLAPAEITVASNRTKIATSDTIRTDFFIQYSYKVFGLDSRSKHNHDCCFYLFGRSPVGCHHLS